MGVFAVQAQRVRGNWRGTWGIPDNYVCCCRLNMWLTMLEQRAMLCILLGLLFYRVMLHMLLSLLLLLLQDTFEAPTILIGVCLPNVLTNISMLGGKSTSVWAFLLLRRSPDGIAISDLYFNGQWWSIEMVWTSLWWFVIFTLWYTKFEDFIKCTYMCNVLLH